TFTDVSSQVTVHHSCENSTSLVHDSNPRILRSDIEVPNQAVDIESSERSACYPRGTFYPLSDHASTSHGRVTSPRFRSCSTRPPHSQAPLCTSTRHLLAHQAEGTPARLRYSLRDNRPSHTTHQALSLNPIRVRSSGIHYGQSGISPIDSTPTSVEGSTSSTYPTQTTPNPNTNL